MIIATKLPSKSVVTTIGTVGTGVPSQVIVTLELAANPAPMTVVAAIPVSGTNAIPRTMVKGTDLTLLAVSVSKGTVEAVAVNV